jgi:hypothetical protein
MSLGPQIFEWHFIECMLLKLQKELIFEFIRTKREAEARFDAIYNRQSTRERGASLCNTSRIN